MPLSLLQSVGIVLAKDRLQGVDPLSEGGGDVDVRLLPAPGLEDRSPRAGDEGGPDMARQEPQPIRRRERDRAPGEAEDDEDVTSGQGPSEADHRLDAMGSDEVLVRYIGTLGGLFDVEHTEFVVGGKGGLGRPHRLAEAKLLKESHHHRNAVEGIGVWERNELMLP